MSKPLGLAHSYKVVPQFRIAKLVNKTRFTIGFTVVIAIVMIMVRWVNESTNVTFGVTTL